MKKYKTIEILIDEENQDSIKQANAFINKIEDYAYECSECFKIEVKEYKTTKIYKSLTFKEVLKYPIGTKFFVQSNNPIIDSGYYYLIEDVNQTCGYKLKNENNKYINHLEIWINESFMSIYNENKFKNVEVISK